jgi:hypothetical protein
MVFTNGFSNRQSLNSLVLKTLNNLVWECPYCLQEMPQPCIGENDSCCGEIGHAVVKEEK